MFKRVSFLLLVLLVFGVAALNVADAAAPAYDKARDADSPLAKFSIPLLELTRDYEQARAARTVAAFVERNKHMNIQDGYVVVDIVAARDTARLERDLKSLGVTYVSSFGRMVSAKVPIDRLTELAYMDSVRCVKAPYKPLTNVGIVTTQGDAAQVSDDARALFGIDGTGLTVGVMSDSHDDLGGEAADVASGDLPGPGNPNGFTAPVNVLLDLGGGGTDEGRGMTQLVHDVAPGANLAFRTAGLGEADFAVGIGQLVAAGADIIVDDIFYFAQPMFQDGLVAQAADAANAAGVHYFSSSGNSARDSYESVFRNPGIDPGIGNPGPAHDFDPGPGNDFFQAITIPTGSRFIFSLQWDQPFGSISPSGAISDVDVYLLDAAATTILASSLDFNIVSGEPVEVIDWTNATAGTNFNILIKLFAGPTPVRIKYVIYRNGDIIEWDTDSGTCTGQGNAAGAIAVGAAPFFATPEFGVDPPQVEPFSSAGGVPILLDGLGNPIPPLIRNKPEISGPDGGNTTFFGSDSPMDPDAFPNFFGTSASAPHVAAVAALMLEQAGGPGMLSTPTILAALQASAIDMDDPATPGFDIGFDFGTGAGLIQATAAVQGVSDTDGDGTVDVFDVDDDNDGVADGTDPQPLNPFVCGLDADSDTCDDCTNGVDGFGPLPDNVPANDGTDTDGDGLCDLGDSDDDNDGVDDPDDDAPLDPHVCRDIDIDTCDDCSQNPASTPPFAPYTPDITDDGPDSDGDGLCDAGDRIWFTTYTTHAIVGQTLFRQAVYQVAPESDVVDLVASGFLPMAANMVALDVKANGNILFAVESPGTVPNGAGTIKLFPGVIYRWNGTKIKAKLKPASVGVALSTLNALDQVGGSYYFAVDATKTLIVDGVRYRLFPSQIWRLKPGGTPKLELVRGFAEFGFDNVDGVDLLPDGRFAISSKENGLGYGIFHTNVYIWDPATDSVSLSYNLGPLNVDNSAGFTLIDAE